MRHPFPEKLQAAMNLSNKSLEAVKVINDWAASHGGSVESLSYEQVKTEVIPLLRRDK